MALALLIGRIYAWKPDKAFCQLAWRSRAEAGASQGYSMRTSQATRDNGLDRLSRSVDNHLLYHIFSRYEFYLEKA